MWGVKYKMKTDQTLNTVCHIDELYDDDSCTKDARFGESNLVNRKSECLKEYRKEQTFFSEKWNKLT